MKTAYRQIIEKAAAQKKQIDFKFKFIKKNKLKAIDDEVKRLHDEAFEQIDCLSCANCCKTTGPLFTANDISRLSQLFGQRKKEYIEENLTIDEEGDYVLQNKPCKYLQEDCKCFIYDKKPKACGGFPHTDEFEIWKILNETKENIKICPAVAHIFINLDLKPFI